MFDADARFLAAVSPADAVERTRTAFLRHHAGEWSIHSRRRPTWTRRHTATSARCPRAARASRSSSGSRRFRATRRAGSRSSPARCSSPAPRPGELLAILDCAAVTSLRTGAAAAVSAQALARDDARVGRRDRLWRQRRVGGEVPGRRRLRAGRLRGRRGPRARRRWRASSAGATGSREEAAAQDVVVTVTPGRRAGDPRRRTCGPASTSRCSAPTPTARPRSSSTRSSAAGSSATSGSRLRTAASSRPASSAGIVERERRDGAGRGAARARPRAATSADDITLFDSTGLAIQDLAIAHGGARARWCRRLVEASTSHPSGSPGVGA